MVKQLKPVRCTILTHLYKYMTCLNVLIVLHFITCLQVLSDLGTYLYKAIPDTKLTIGKYADAKFEYLSFCLKVKEMDDEEFNYASIQEPLYRVETGNYEYRYIRIRINTRNLIIKYHFGLHYLTVNIYIDLCYVVDKKHVQDLQN